MNTRQYVIERGAKAEALLKDPLFMDGIIRDVEAELVNEMLATAPHEAKKRESLYAKHQGLKEIVGMIREYIAIGEQAKEPQGHE